MFMPSDDAKTAEEQTADDKSDSESNVSLQLSGSQCQELIEWAKKSLDIKVNDVKVILFSLTFFSTNLINCS